MANYAGSGGGGGPSVQAPKKQKVKPTYGVSGIKATPAAAPARPRSNGGGGNSGGSGGSSRPRSSGSGYSGGSGVGSNSAGNIAPVKPPKPPSLAAFLGSDSTYMQQKSALEKAKADYLAQQNESKTNYLTGYATDLDTLGKNRTSALGDLENDFASRGLLQSGLYADSLSSANNDWDKRTSALEQARAQFLRQLSGDYNNYSQEQLLTLQRAEQEAAARRAAQYGV